MYGHPSAQLAHASAVAPTRGAFWAWVKGCAYQTALDLGDAPTVAVLFARANSVYFDLDGCDVFDMERDARTYTGNLPVVAHPPCRGWGRLRGMAKPRPDELDLAYFAVDAVRRCGGVLEHPAFSKLWEAAGLPFPGQRDAFGGFTLPILQQWFGHAAPKATWLYVCGCEPSDVPPMPFQLGLASGRVELLGRAAREATPPDLAAWLRDLAAGCSQVAVVSTTATNSPSGEKAGGFDAL